MASKPLFSDTEDEVEDPFPHNRENYGRCIALVRQRLDGKELSSEDSEWLKRTTWAEKMRNTMAKHVLLKDAVGEYDPPRADFDTVYKQVKEQQIYGLSYSPIKKAYGLIVNHFIGRDPTMVSFGYDWLFSRPDLKEAVCDAIAAQADDAEVLEWLKDWGRIIDDYFVKLWGKK